MKIYVALVDDHQVTRNGIAALLKQDINIEVTADLSNGIELLSYLHSTDQMPEIIILDLLMPEMNGFKTLDELQLKYPSIKVIIFTFYIEIDTVINAMSRGASAYLHKSEDPEILRIAVHKVATDGYFINDITKKLINTERIPAKKRTGFQGRIFLTALELEFIKLAISDLSLQQIAEKMNKTRSTVENYRDSIFTKLKISSRPALVSYAYLNGLLDF